MSRLCQNSLYKNPKQSYARACSFEYDRIHGNDDIFPYYVKETGWIYPTPIIDDHLSAEVSEYDTRQQLNEIIANVQQMLLVAGVTEDKFPEEQQDVIATTLVSTTSKSVRLYLKETKLRNIDELGISEYIAGDMMARMDGNEQLISKGLKLLSEVDPVIHILLDKSDAEDLRKLTNKARIINLNDSELENERFSNEFKFSEYARDYLKTNFGVHSDLDEIAVFVATVVTSNYEDIPGKITTESIPKSKNHTPSAIIFAVTELQKYISY